METLLKKLSVVRNFSKGFHFCYVTLIQPKATTEDERRREFILNILLTSFISALLVFDSIIFYNMLVRGASYDGVSLERFFGVTLVFIVMLALSRKGFFVSVSYALIAMCLSVALLSSYTWGVGLPAGLLCYTLTISMATVLISTRFGALLTVCILCVVISFGYIETNRGTLPEWRLQTIVITDSIQYAVLLSLAMGISFLSNRETERSLRRARASEQALKEKNESLEAIVEERTRELREAQAEKVSHLYRFAEFGRLSAGLFHDLVNPLTLVSATVHELASHNTKNGAELGKHLDRAVQASKKMERFMMTAKKQMSSESTEGTFVVNDEIEEVLTLFNYKALEQKVQILFSAKEKVTLYGSPIKFQQIITNLLSNAIDACSGEDIPPNRKRVELSLIRKESFVKIKVTDYGCGIEKDLVEKVFDPFFTTKANHAGMGLGLSTMKTIVEKHFEGSISLASKKQEGSMFTIILPIRTE